jgi:hypothetical protein
MYLIEDTGHFLNLIHKHNCCLGALEMGFNLASKQLRSFQKPLVGIVLQ